jgi:hypothetical protein
MAEAAITKSLSDLRKVFSQMHNIYFTKTTNQDLATLASFDMELPVVEGGVTFKSGEAQLTKTKLTTGELWDVTSKSGDDDISYQIASYASEILAAFTNADSTATAMTATVNGVTYEGYGVNTSPKKVSGALFMTSEDLSAAIYIPNAQIFSNLVNENDKPAYINSKVSALADTTGKNIYVLFKKAA